MISRSLSAAALGVRLSETMEKKPLNIQQVTTLVLVACCLATLHPQVDSKQLQCTYFSKLTIHTKIGFPD
jgi:hypothetical protein